MTNETLIQKKLQGRLTQEQELTFATLIKEDHAFAKAYEEQRNLKKAIATVERNSLKQQLQQLEQTAEAVVSKRKSPITTWIAIAAVIAIAIFGSTFLFTGLGSSSAPSGEELYATYYEVYPNVLQPVTRGDQDESLATTAFTYYENGAYEKAATSFGTVLETEEDIDVRFYYAMSLLNAGDTQSALPILETIAQSATRFSPQSYWYIALSQLQEGNKEVARDYLVQLDALDSGFKTKKVEALIEQLERN